MSSPGTTTSSSPPTISTSSTTISKSPTAKLPEGVSLDGFLDAEIDRRIAEGKGWSPEDFHDYVKDIPDNHPLFAESLEEMDPSMVEMFSNLKYEGQSSLALMENCKKQGNQQFQWGNKGNKVQYIGAIKSYSEAIDWANQVEEEDQKTMPDFWEKKSNLYTNRAFASFNLKNFRSCIMDCDTAIVVNPSNIKAFYRKAKAAWSLKLYKETIAICKQGLQVIQQEFAKQQLEKGDEAEATLVDPKEIEKKGKDLQTILLSAEKEQDKLETKEREKKARIQQRLAELKAIWNYCQGIGIKLGNIVYPGSFQQHQADYLPRLVDHHGNQIKIGEIGGVGGIRGIGGKEKQEIATSAEWNCLFLYPQYATFDIVTEITENEMIAIQLANLFPEFDDEDYQGYYGTNSRAAWDQKGEYQCSELDIYIQAKGGHQITTEAEYLASMDLLKKGTGSNLNISTDSDSEHEKNGNNDDDDGDDDDDAEEEEVETEVVEEESKCGPDKKRNESNKSSKKLKKKGKRKNKKNMDTKLLEEKLEEAFSKNIEWGEYWLQVHPGCTLKQILTYKDNVIPITLPTFHIYPRQAKAHQIFRAMNKDKIQVLNPTGM